MQRSPDSFLIMFVSGIAALGVLIWFVNRELGSTAALVVVGGLFGAVMWMGGSVLTHATVKATMENLSEFNRADAKIDAGRMQAFKALAQGDAALQRAAAQLTVLDAKRVNSIASQQAKLLVDSTRQSEAQSTSWDVFDDDDADIESFVQWE